MQATVEGQVLGMRAGSTPKGKAFHEVELLQAGNGRSSDIVRVRFWNGAPQLDVGKSASIKACLGAWAGKSGQAFVSLDVF